MGHACGDRSGANRWSWKDSGGGEAQVLRPSHHQVERLDRLPRRAFHEVVQCSYRDDPAGPRVGEDADIAEIGTADVSRVGHGILAQADEPLALEKIPIE